MGEVMSAFLIIRRIAGALALAIVITCGVGMISTGAAAWVFIPSWVGLFFVWPFLSRKLGVDFPKPPATGQGRRFSLSSLVITGLLATVLSVMFNLMFDVGNPAIWIIPFWFTLYYGWPNLTRTRQHLFLNFDRRPAAPVPVRPLWLRFMRGTLASVGGVVLVFSIVFVPISISFIKARRAHDSVHIGMTVPEVLNAINGCDVFSASSDFPYDLKDRSNIPAVSFGLREGGTYQMYDLPAHRPLPLSAPEVIEHIHATLHDGYNWQFRYAYTNITPQHLSFSVVFGPDGRVSQVKPIYGWD